MIIDSAPSAVSECFGRADVEGFYHIDNDTYHLLPGVSSTNTADIMVDPAAYLNGESAFDKDPNADHFVFGSMVHEALMFPDSFRDLYNVFPGKVRRGKKWEAFKDECSEAGLIAIPNQMMDDCNRIIEMVGDVPEHDALFSSPFNNYELSGWINEPESGILCKIRTDVLRLLPSSPTVVDIVDIKTAPTAEFEIDPGVSRYTKGFKYSIRSYGYYRQQAFYNDMLENMGYTVNSFRFFVIGKDLKGNALYTLGDEWIEEGREEYKDALASLKRIIMGV